MIKTVVIESCSGTTKVGADRPAEERDVQRLFPLALVACIQDGRGPEADEVALMASTLISDTLPAMQFTPHQALAGARVALFGSGVIREQQLAAA